MGKQVAQDTQQDSELQAKHTEEETGRERRPVQQDEQGTSAQSPLLFR